MTFPACSPQSQEPGLSGLRVGWRTAQGPLPFLRPAHELGPAGHADSCPGCPRVSSIETRTSRGGAGPFTLAKSPPPHLPQACSRAQRAGSVLPIPTVRSMVSKIRVSGGQGHQLGSCLGICASLAAGRKITAKPSGSMVDSPFEHSWDPRWLLEPSLCARGL